MITGLQTLFTGRQLTHLKTVNSTNRYLSELLSDGPQPEGAALVASFQTGGRGQAGASWVSEEGKNLLMSLVFYPSFLSIQHLFMLSKTFSLGIYDTLHELAGEKIKIKWPNDIFYGDKKLCGMLIENSIRTYYLNHSLLGIGLNVNQEIFPGEIPNPVSLKIILEKSMDVDDCFRMICNSIERRYLQLKSGHQDQLHSDYLQALYRYEEFHEFESNNKKFKAKITGIGDDGKIILTYQNRLMGKYDLKELKYLF